MPEWWKIFEAEDSDFGGGAKCVLPLKWVPRCLAFGNGRPRSQNRPKQTTISPGKRACVYASGVESILSGAKSLEREGRLTVQVAHNTATPQSAATNSISTSASFRSPAACTVERADTEPAALDASVLLNLLKRLESSLAENI
jgi:hypothetical protein